MQLKCRLHHVHWLALCPASVWVCVARPALSQINRATAVYTFVSPETSHTLQNTKKTRKYRQRGRGLCRYRHNHILLMGCKWWKITFLSVYIVLVCLFLFYTILYLKNDYTGIFWQHLPYSSECPRKAYFTPTAAFQCRSLSKRLNDILSFISMAVTST